jgi:hypothetical protein
MVTSKYYQHLYRLVTNESTQDATGAWVQGSKTWVYVGLCREETNGKGSSVATADGNVLVFSSLVYMPIGTPRIDEGTQILILRNQQDVSNITDTFITDGKISGEVVIIGRCMKFDMGRLHCRMWI